MIQHQACSLEDYEWPHADPFMIAQETRMVTATDHQLVNACLSEASIDLALVTKPHHETLMQAEKILYTLSHRKFQMNPVGAVRDEHEWLERINVSIQKGMPVEIVYPLFCVIPSGPKRYETVEATAGEECAVRLFGMINEYVKEIYPPGILVHVLVDSALYAHAFQTPMDEVREYSESLSRLVSSVGAQDYLQFHDYAELLDSSCDHEYDKSYAHWHHDLSEDDLAHLVGGEALAGLRKSVRACVNTRQFELSHDDLLHLFGPQSVRDESHPLHSTIERMTDLALADYVAIRFACNDVDIATKLWPHALRATAHKGQTNGRWALGMKPYPEYYGNCKILPYHGVPKIVRKNGTTKLEVYPEVMLRGDDSLVRVMAENNRDVYAYVSEDLA